MDPAVASGAKRSDGSEAHQVFEDHLVEVLVIPIGDEGAGFGFVVGAGFGEEGEEGATAVVEVF